MSHLEEEIVYFLIVSRWTLAPAVGGKILGRSQQVLSDYGQNLSFSSFVFRITHPGGVAHDSEDNSDVDFDRNVVAGQAPLHGHVENNVLLGDEVRNPQSPRHAQMKSRGPDGLVEKAAQCVPGWGKDRGLGGGGGRSNIT